MVDVQAIKLDRTIICLVVSLFLYSDSFGQVTNLVEISPEILEMTNEELLELTTQYDLEYRSREASFELAERYFYGLGAARNLEKAAFYFEVSANPVSGEYAVDENGVGHRLQNTSPFSDAAYERMEEINRLISAGNLAIKPIPIMRMNNCCP